MALLFITCNCGRPVLGLRPGVLLWAPSLTSHFPLPTAHLPLPSLFLCVQTHLDSPIHRYIVSNHGIGISDRFSAPQFVGTSEAIVKRLYAQNIN